MIRNVDIKDISNGVLYGLEDMVRLGCGDCEGCSFCCENMGDTIILDPLDVWRLGKACQKDFEGMLGERVELGFVDGAILPHMALTGEGGACTFLNAEGRCGIHPYRPGFCRIFPLGRYYHDGTFSYILQEGECKKGGRVKVKIRKWVDTPLVVRYDRYIRDWHFFIRELGEVMQAVTKETASDLSLYVLKLFYGKSYGAESYEDFYADFDVRLAEAKEVLLDVKGEGPGEVHQEEVMEEKKEGENPEEAIEEKKEGENQEGAMEEKQKGDGET